MVIPFKWLKFVQITLKSNKNNMNNTKQILDTVVETQTKAMNSFVETATKFQEALKSENAFEKST